MAEFYNGPIFVTQPIFGKPKKAWEEESAPEDESKKSFYPYFRKFATFYKCLGCFPVSISKSSSKLSYAWNNALTLSSVLVFPIIQLVYMWLNPISDPVIKFFVYLFLIIPFLVRLIFIIHTPALIRLIQAMDALDTDPCLAESKPELTKKDCKFVVICCLITLFLTTFPHMIWILGDVPEAFSWYWLKFQAIFAQVSQVSLYYIVCYQMNHFYDRFSVSLEALSEKPCEEVKEEEIESHRLVHARLVTCVRLMNDAFGVWLGYIYFINSSWFVIECYLSIYGTHNKIHGFTLLQIVLTLFYIYYPAVLSDYIFNKNTDTIHFILKMALEPFPDDELFQLMYFLRQIKVNVAAVNAAGLANVNKRIITKALSLFATTFVATIQLEPQVVDMIAVLRVALEGEKAPLLEAGVNTTLAAITSG